MHSVTVSNIVRLESWYLDIHMYKNIFDVLAIAIGMSVKIYGQQFCSSYSAKGKKNVKKRFLFFRF